MKQEVKQGETDYTILILVRDTSGNAATQLAFGDIDLAYSRVETDNDVTTTDVAPADLAGPALSDPHLDWGFLEVEPDDHPGLYRLDIADAVFAAGAWSAVVSLTGADLEPSHCEFMLVPASPLDGVAVSEMGADVLTAAAIAPAAIDNATWAADVGSTAYATNIIALAVRKALDEIRLDHLVFIADADDVVDDSIMAKIAASDGDWSNFASATDALQALAASLSSIANVGAAVNTPSESFTLTDGNVVANTFADTVALDQVYHQINDEDGSTGDIDCYYQFDIGGDGSPTSVTITGRINSVGNNHDVLAYNWSTTSWGQIGAFASKAQSVDDVNTYTLFTSHVGTAGNLGKVRIRLLGTGLSGPDIYIDQIFVSYAIVARSVGYEGGSVWIDTVGGTAGTESFVNGTADNPALTLADALTIQSNMGLNSLHILAGSSVTLTASYISKVMLGDSYTLALGGQDISGSKFKNAISVTGIMTAPTGVPIFDFCGFGNVTLSPCATFQCGFFGTITIGVEGSFVFGSSSTYLPHGTDTVFDYGAGLDASNIECLGWTGGGIEIQNAGAGAGTYIFSIHGWGEVELNANCSATFECNLYGNFEFTNNAAGITVEEEANYNETQADALITANASIAAILVDTDTTIPGLVAALNDIAAADVWTEGSARIEDYGLLLEKLADWHFNEKTVTDATGAVLLRNQGDSGDLASWGITDNATITVSTEISWP